MFDFQFDLMKDDIKIQAVAKNSNHEKPPPLARMSRGSLG